MSLLLVLIVSLVVFVLICLVVVSLPTLRYSVTIRTLEAACGLGAGLIGCLGLAYAVFGPVYRFESSSGESGTQNIVQVGIPSGALVALGILVLGLIAVVVSAIVHSRTGGSGWRIVLWVASMFLVIMTFLTGFSIGLFLLPSTLLALLASAFSLGARRAALG